MQTALLIVALLALAGLGAALVWLASCLRALRADLDRLTGDAEAGAIDLAQEDARPRLVVDVHNPIEVACENSRYARSLAGVAPGLVRRRVYEIVARELEEELAQRGVQAEVSVRKS